MTNRSFDAAVVELAARQSGAIARWQVIDELDGSDTLIHRRLRSNRWQVALPGVYLLAGLPDHPLRRYWIAVLAAGPRAVLSHSSAAHLLRFPAFERTSRIELIVPHGRHHRIPGVMAHQIDDLDDRHTMTVDGLPVTNPARTFVDLPLTTSPGRIKEALEGMIVSRRITADRIGRVLGEVMRPGKPRLGVLVELLDLYGPGIGVPESVLEAELVELTREAGILDFHVQCALPGEGRERCRSDIRIPDSMLLLEADGRRWHARWEAMAEDRRRDQDSSRAGHVTLRFTWEQIREERMRVVQSIRDTHAMRLRQLGRAA